MDMITNTPREVYNAAHPILVVDATKSRNRNDILSWALTSLKDVYLIEYIGTINKAGKTVSVGKLLAWRCCSNSAPKKYDYNIYDVEEIVYLLDKIHVDVDLASTYVWDDHEVFADADCKNAPIFAFPEGFTLEVMHGNISNMERYTEMMRAYGNNIVAMGDSDRHIRGVQNQTTGKEDN